MGLWDLAAAVAEEEVVEEESNRYLRNSDMGLELITKLLSSEIEETQVNLKFSLLERLIDVEYYDFANRSDIANEAEIYAMMMRAKLSLEEAIKFPFLTNKKVIAIGGGFSAGKSRFVNSLLGDDILPTDTRPTTSIPTYISNGAITNIYAYNIFGNKIRIDREAVSAISHAFTSRFKVGFTQILKNITLQSNKMPFKNLVFLDTPGYTKSDTYKKADNTDEHVAREHLKLADGLLWLIDIEKGTIPQQDIEFIRSLNFKRPIFFIFTKADKKEPSEINKILKVAKENLKSAGIPIAGLTAYSAVERKEYGGGNLIKYLCDLDIEAKAVELEKLFVDIFNMYEANFKTEIKNEQDRLSMLNKVALFSGIDNERDILNKLIQESKSKILKKQDLEKEISNLSNKIFKAIDELIIELEKEKLVQIQKEILSECNNEIITVVLEHITAVEEEFRVKCTHYSRPVEIRKLAGNAKTRKMKLNNITDGFVQALEGVYKSSAHKLVGKNYNFNHLTRVFNDNPAEKNNLNHQIKDTIHRINDEIACALDSDNSVFAVYRKNTSKAVKQFFNEEYDINQLESIINRENAEVCDILISNLETALRDVREFLMKK